MIETRFKDTEIGKIPEDWELLPLHQGFDFRSNNTLSRDALSDNGFIMNIHYGDVLIKFGATVDVQKEALPYITNTDYKNAYYAEDGDIIIADTAEDETVGKATELLNIKDSLVVSGLHTMWLHPTSSNIFAKGYLGYAFNCALFHDQLIPLMQGTKVTSVSKTAIKDTYIAVPSDITEQSRIASALTSIDNLISSLDKLIEKKKNIKQGMMQQLLTGKKRLKGFTEPWVEKRLGEILSLRNGFAFKSESYTSAGSYKIITIANVQNGKLDLSEYNSITEIPASIQHHQILSKGDILISMTGNIGRVCRVDSTNCLLNQRVGVLDIRPGINSDFVFTALNTTVFENAMRDKGQGVAEANIGKKEIEDYMLIIPYSPAEQKAIASVLTSMDNEISALESKKAKYESMKQGMMQQLLTGKIRLI